MHPAIDELSKTRAALEYVNAKRYTALAYGTPQSMLCVMQTSRNCADVPKHALGKYGVLDLA